MKMQHCNFKFEANEVWFLKDIVSDIPQKAFYDRKMLFGKCPICNKNVVILEEYRKFDNKYFFNILKGNALKTALKNENKRIIHTQTEANLNNYKKKVQAGSMGLIQQ